MKSELTMKNKIEFKKIALAVILILSFVFITWSFILAQCGIYQTNSGISETLVNTVLGSYVAYVIASFSEKNSRNKYGIDERGKSLKDSEGEKGDD